MSQSNEIVPLSPSSSEPSADWGLEKLAEFVREAGTQVGVLEADVLKIGGTILRLHYERGKALVLVRDEVLVKKRGAWARFRKDNGFAGTTYDDDIRLYESAYSWKEIAGMGLTEARIYLGVVKPKVRVPKKADAAPLAELPSADSSETMKKCGQQASLANALTTLSASGPSDADEPGTEATPPVVPVSMVSGSKSTAEAIPAAEETLLKIVRRLEELEREIQGRIGEAAYPFIDRAVEVLGRLRGSVAGPAIAA